MGQGEVEFILTGQSDPVKICAFGADIAEKLVVIFKSTFLAGLHRVAVKDAAPPDGIVPEFKPLSVRELGTSVC